MQSMWAHDHPVTVVTGHQLALRKAGSNPVLGRRLAQLSERLELCLGRRSREGGLGWLIWG